MVAGGRERATKISSHPSSRPCVCGDLPLPRIPLRPLAHTTGAHPALIPAAAAKSYRSQEDPEQQPFADAAGKSAPVQAAGDDELRGAKSKRERSTLSDVWDEILVFVRDPVPFLADTANVDDDTVHHRAGLEARLYLHFLRTLLTLFTIIAFVVCALIIPANIMTARASWMPLGYYSSTTANGFAHPSASLLLHTLVSVFISVVVVVVVYFTREHLVSNVRGDLQNKAATPPVQAYTVEIQGMRLNPPVRPEEVMTMLDASPNLKGQHSDVVSVFPSVRRDAPPTGRSLP